MSPRKMGNSVSSMTGRRRARARRNRRIATVVTAIALALALALALLLGAAPVSAMEKDTTMVVKGGWLRLRGENGKRQKNGDKQADDRRRMMIAVVSAHNNTPLYSPVVRLSALSSD